MGYLCEFVFLFLTVQQFRTEDACTLCDCLLVNVNCVGLNLTYIPRLPKKTVTFSFTHNYLPNITEETFQNISSLKIRTLILSSNRINFVHEDPFKKFKHLKELDISGNKLTLKSVRNVLYSCNVHRISTIYLRNVGINNLPPDAFHGPLMSLLKFVDLSRNNLKLFDLTAFKSLKRLTTLIVKSNKLERIITHTMPNLQRLYLSSNSFRDVPQLCSGDNASFPRLNQLFLRNNSISEYIPENVNCLKKLAQLDLSLNSIYLIKSNSFSSLPRLGVLKLSEQTLKISEQSRSSLKLEKYALTNSNLGQLLLRNSRIMIKYLDNLAFAGCHNLRLLDFSKNKLYSYYQDIDKINIILSPLKQLRILSLQYTDLRTVPSVIQTFSNLQQLKLEGNDIKTWPMGTFDANPNLTNLRLTNNKIITVTEDMFSAKVRKRLKLIGMDYNPFICDCKLVWFIQWLNQDHKRFVHYPDGYKCVNITERICLNNIAVFKSVIGVSCVIMLVLLIISIIFKYRWSIKYQIYIWRHQSKQLQKLHERRFKYDVFVSYSADDSNWVWDHLASRLEGEDDIKLCVHERDFAAGRLIIDNIVESIEDSRHALIVVSNNFARSDWCQFEMTLAQKHVLNELMDPLVVVLLEDIENEYMSKALKALLSTTTYLEWNEDPGVSAIFWQKLRRSLKNHH